MSVVQKGGGGLPGCLAAWNMWKLSPRSSEKPESKGDLAVLWLGLTNVYGPIPHSLVKTTLQRHHVPSKTRNIICDYENNFRFRVSFGLITSSWYCLKKGIIIGCTMLPFLQRQKG